MTKNDREKPRINLSKMEEFLNGIDSAVQQKFNSVSPQSIVDSIIKDFMDQRAEVLAKLMGFSKDSFNKKWEIDHCNGRAGNSPIGNWISEAFSEKIKPIITEAFQEMLEGGFRETVKKEIKHELTCRLSYGIRDITEKVIGTVVCEVAKENAEELKEFIKGWMLKKNDLLEK